MRQELIERVFTAWTRGGPLPREPMTDAEYRYADGIMRDAAVERGAELTSMTCYHAKHEWPYEADLPCPVRRRKAKPMRQALIEQAVEAYHDDAACSADVFEAIVERLTDQEWRYVKGVLDDGDDEENEASDARWNEAHAAVQNGFRRLSMLSSKRDSLGQ